MLIKNKDSHTFTFSDACSVREYPLGIKDINVAVAKINGRFPDQGRLMNTACEEIYYIVSGSGVIHHDSGDFELNQGDQFLIEKNTQYWVEGNNLEIVVSCAPAWFKEQHIHIKE